MVIAFKDRCEVDPKGSSNDMDYWATRKCVSIHKKLVTLHANWLPYGPLIFHEHRHCSIPELCVYSTYLRVIENGKHVG